MLRNQCYIEHGTNCISFPPTRLESQKKAEKAEKAEKARMGELLGKLEIQAKQVQKHKNLALYALLCVR